MMENGKNIVEQMILSILKEGYGIETGISTQDEPRKVASDFETSAFTSHMNAILGNLDQMKKVVEQNEGLSDGQLRALKDKPIGDLYLAVSSVEDAINLRLDPPESPGEMEG